jgi:hypothetical protein
VEARMMAPARVVLGFAVATSCLVTLGCDVDLDLSAPLLDWATFRGRVCGFPTEQLDTANVGPPSYGVAIGRLRLGQRLRVELIGDLSRVRSVEWRVSPGASRTEVHAAFETASRDAAILIGQRLSADDFDYDFASAHIVFRDDSEATLPVSVCSGGGWRPADHIVVVP